MSLAITGAQLRAIGGSGALRTNEVAAFFNDYAPVVGLDVEHRAEHFFGQLAHESGGFRFYKEIWGPTPAQRRYEGRKDLGNTVKGDGSRYRGRGPIQITGRANYTAFTEWCRARYPDCPDFVKEPQRLEDTRWGLLAAFWFWDTRGLNALADRNDLTGITKRINGGTNGLSDRRYRYGLAVRAIVSSDPQVPKPIVDKAGRPLLKKGSKGDHVRALQAALGVEADGIFGTQTQLAVLVFQRKNGLLPDGRVGGLTWARL